MTSDNLLTALSQSFHRDVDLGLVQLEGGVEPGAVEQGGAAGGGGHAVQQEHNLHSTVAGKLKPLRTTG